MRISYWSSDVCSSDLLRRSRSKVHVQYGVVGNDIVEPAPFDSRGIAAKTFAAGCFKADGEIGRRNNGVSAFFGIAPGMRSEEHTSELQSLMRISYAVFCLKKKNKTNNGIENRDDTTTHRNTHKT